MSGRVVLHLTGMRSTKYGSFERYLVRVAEKCRERGFGTVMQYDSLPVSEEYVRDLERAEVRVELASSRSTVVSALAACSRLVLTYRPAVIHNHFVPRTWDLMVPPLGRLVGSSSLVRTVHSDIGYRSRSRMRHVFNRYDTVHAVSDAVRRSLEAGGVDSSRIRTVYLGLSGVSVVDNAARRGLRQQLGLAESATVIGSIAFDSPVKGVDLLLRAFARLLESHPDTYLLQVGVDPLASDLPALADRLRVSDRVVWAGVVDDGWQLLHAVDIYVQPSRSEGMGLSVLEAMASGLPVVATNVGGLSEAVIDQETGLAVDPDPTSLAAAIGEMLDNPARWKEFGDRGRERFMELFDGEASVERLVGGIYGMRSRL